MTTIRCEEDEEEEEITAGGKSYNFQERGLMDSMELSGLGLGSDSVVKVGMWMKINRGNAYVSVRAKPSPPLLS